MTLCDYAKFNMNNASMLNSNKIVIERQKLPNEVALHMWFAKTLLIYLLQNLDFAFLS
jgi:ABC-type microcin C transport system permease subunit YejB